MHNIEVNENENKTVQVKMLPQGHTCIYKVHGQCGRVKVKISKKTHVVTDIKQEMQNWNEGEMRIEGEETPEETIQLRVLSECKED
jgi:hypothetical protein